VISYLPRASRSIPNPNTRPVYFSLSIPTASNTFGSTIPHPPISTQFSVPSLPASNSSTSPHGSLARRRSLGHSRTSMHRAEASFDAVVVRVFPPIGLTGTHLNQLISANHQSLRGRATRSTPNGVTHNPQSIHAPAPCQNRPQNGATRNRQGTLTHTGISESRRRSRSRIICQPTPPSPKRRLTTPQARAPRTPAHSHAHCDTLASPLQSPFAAHLPTHPAIPKTPSHHTSSPPHTRRHARTITVRIRNPWCAPHNTTAFIRRRR
jgi:hypothetical protein